jgi:hypothetical protein
LSIASAAAAGESGAGLGAIVPPLWSAAPTLVDCALESPAQAATAPPAIAVSAVLRRKSRRDPAFAKSAVTFDVLLLSDIAGLLDSSSLVSRKLRLRNDLLCREMED